jgi:serine/threonine protein kinase
VIKLFDFGSAHMPELQREVAQDQATSGTPEYLAPEQLSRAEVDHRCDVYALGVTLHECLTGTVPFEGNRTEVLRQIDSGRRIPVALRAPLAHPGLAAVIDCALAPNPDQRFATASAFAQALDEALPAPPDVGSLLGIRSETPRQQASNELMPASAAVVLPAAPPPLPVQRRQFQRAPYVTPVRVDRSTGTPIQGRSEDISVGGMLVLTAQSCHQAESVRVRFALPLSGLVAELPAIAKWVKLGRGTEAMGLQFAAVPPEALQQIERYVVLMSVE